MPYQNYKIIIKILLDISKFWNTMIGLHLELDAPHYTRIANNVLH